MRNLNKPNRYNVASIQAQQTLGGDVMQSNENGQYVEWRDYKWLLDEVERLKEGNECLNQMHEKEMARSAYLCEQVERLRKAGDAMLYNMTYYKSFVPDNGNIHHMIDASILGWNPKYGHTTEYGKAKEGKQS